MVSDLLIEDPQGTHVPLIFRATGVDVNNIPTYGNPLSFTHIELLWLADEFNQGSIQTDSIVARYTLSKEIVAQVTLLNTENPFSFLDHTGYLAFRSNLPFVHTLATPALMAQYVSKLLSEQQVATVARDSMRLKP